MAERVEVGRTDDFPAGTQRGVDHKGPKYLVVRLEDGFYGLAGMCTHEYAELATGYLTGDQVLCPLHSSLFDVRSGEVLSSPATEDLRTFPVEVTEGRVYLVVDE